MNWEQLVSKYRVSSPKHFRLSETDPGDTWKLKSKEHAAEYLERGVERLSELQAYLYAENRWALLLIFQAMDAAGKDGTIKHVMSGVNPQGCQVCSFKAPSEEELNHDFLWRATKYLPERGRIGIFNRSYYEEVLVVRVHPEWLERQKIPAPLRSEDIWERRFEDINNYERYLTRNGIVIRKFFLHVSKEEQRQRFLKRLEDPERNWKFSNADVHERARWKDYQRAYEDMIRHTSTELAPWFVIPADHKWFTRLAVAEIVVDALQSLDLKYPEVSGRRRRELSLVRRQLEKSR
jgi:PPK2 family polyphosphate:nucleotide phosphotransferase